MIETFEDVHQLIFPDKHNSEKSLAKIQTHNSSIPPAKKKAKKEASTSKSREEIVVLALDEAHTMTKLLPGADGSPPWSAFSELRRALRALHDHGIFSLFLSTTGKVSQFSWAKEDDPSTRVRTGELDLIMPFTDLGFDQFADKSKMGAEFTVEAAASIDHIVTFGRPL